MADPDHWNYAGRDCTRGWGCFFEPLSNCSEADAWQPYTLDVRDDTRVDYRGYMYEVGTHHLCIFNGRASISFAKNAVETPHGGIWCCLSGADCFHARLIPRKKTKDISWVQVDGTSSSSVSWRMLTF